MMILQAQDDSTLAVIYLLSAVIIPFLVLWFDDGMIHGKK